MNAPSMTSVERLIADGFDLGTRTYLHASRDSRLALVHEARKYLLKYREKYHVAGGPGTMLTQPGAQPKTGKNDMYTLIFMGSPNTTAGVGNVCPGSTAGCRTNCLGPESGHAALAGSKDGYIVRARHARTALLVEQPYHAAVLITHELYLARARHEQVALRLNGVTDIRWELCAPLTLRYYARDGVRLYDYTKWSPHLRRSAPGFYRLTYSATELSDEYDLSAWLDAGRNVAIPVRIRKGQPLPEYLELAGTAYPTIDGDLTDDRTTDQKYHVVLLRAKGRTAWHDTTGFIWDLEVPA